jgi:hypothetical protein
MYVFANSWTMIPHPTADLRPTLNHCEVAAAVAPLHVVAMVFHPTQEPLLPHDAPKLHDAPGQQI